MIYFHYFLHKFISPIDTLLFCTFAILHGNRVITVMLIFFSMVSTILSTLYPSTDCNTRLVLHYAYFCPSSTFVPIHICPPKHPPSKCLTVKFFFRYPTKAAISQVHNHLSSAHDLPPVHPDHF